MERKKMMIKYFEHIFWVLYDALVVGLFRDLFL